MRFEDKVAKLRIEKHGGRETAEFLADVKKMLEGEAFEYLMGEVDFCGAKIDLSLRPMIPREESEFWVGQAIEQIKEARSKKQEVARGNAPHFRVLDLFSGSGNVGLAILKNISDSMVDFIEYDSKLKEQIEISIEKNKIDKSRTKVITGDVFAGAVGKYDSIFAIPPYVPRQMKEEVMKELHAEPELSFFDKEDGFFYIKKVLSEAKNYLNENGNLFMEFDITQKEKIEELVKNNEHLYLKDNHGNDCAVMLK